MLARTFGTLFFVGVFLILIPHHVFASGKLYSINTAGGGCSLIGVWDASTWTCTLTHNVDGMIEIDNSFITLNGNGHTLIMDSAYNSSGVHINGFSGVTIKNLTINGKGGGIDIYFDRANGGRAINNTIISESIAIDFFDGSGGEASRNKITPVAYSGYQYGIVSSYSNNLAIHDNTILNSGYGIALYHIASSSVMHNTISTTTTGIYLTKDTALNISNNKISHAAESALDINANGSLHNTIYKNIFRDSVIGVTVDAHYKGPQTFSISLPRAPTFSYADLQLPPSLPYSLIFVPPPPPPQYVASSTGAQAILFGNTFINNGTPASVSPYAFVRFYNPLPDGGNTWSTYDTPSEGCHDTNHNGFCDSPYVIDPVNHIIDKYPRVLTTCASGCASNVLFIPGTESSRLYYRDALNIEHQVWEPDLYTDIPYLAMNADGTSKYKLYTKDIIGSLEEHNPLESIIANRFGNDLQIYGKFEKFMNRLVASSTIKAWRSYPYDWRYDVRDIVNDGTLTEMPNGSTKRIYLENVLEQLASTSPTGKVIIVAHSNGGLVAKALIQKLVTDGKSNLADKLIMIATPQWGTPAATGVLLHGDGQTQALGLIMQSNKVRAVLKTMPGPYDLLPSPAYFSHVADPVVTFDSYGVLSGKFATSFGAVLTSFPKFVDFLENTTGLDAQAGSINSLRAPLALPSTLVTKAIATHTALDSWTPPAGITVTTLAGWGQDTVKTLAYTTKQKTICYTFSAIAIGAFGPPCTTSYYLEHTPVTTQDGDGTVVTPSAIGTNSSHFYFDSFLFKKNKKEEATHRSITAVSPIQNVVKDILTSINPDTEQYITTTKPIRSISASKIRISSHSPVNLVVTDAYGKQSGILPIPGTDFSGVKRDILGSSVQVFDTEEYINVPKSGTYHIVARGYAGGSSTLRLETISSNGIASTTETFANIPTTASSTITFSITNGNPTAPIIDLAGTGKNTFTIPISVTPLSYVQYMKKAISAMVLSRREHSTINRKLSEIIRSLTKEHRIKRELEDGEKGRHEKYENTHHRYLSLVKFKINRLKHYIEWQFLLFNSTQYRYKDEHRYKYFKENSRDHDRDTKHSEHIQHHKHKQQSRGIPAIQTETILGMINKLKALFQ